MVRDGRGITLPLALLVAVLTTAVAWIGLSLWVGSGHALPGASWGGAVLIVFMAVGVYCAGLPVRRFLRGEATRPLSPLRAMRTLVLAQAAALTGRWSPAGTPRRRSSCCPTPTCPRCARPCCARWRCA